MMTSKYVYLDRGLVAVAGADRRPFLQNLITQDVERVSPTHAAYGALLTPQGKYLHDFCVAELDDRLILDGEAGRADELAARLSRYKLRSKVEISPLDGYAVIAVFGGDAAAIFGLAGTPGAATRLRDGVAFVDPRAAELGVRVIMPAAAADEVGATLAIERGDLDAYDDLRIRLGVPDGSRDMDVDKSILLECNFDALNGIDWDKGCYVGQEVTARTKYRGLVKRRLVPVAVDGAAPAPGTPIEADGKRVGEIRSGRAGFALASLRLDVVQGDQAERRLVAGDATVSPSVPRSTA